MLLKSGGDLVQQKRYLLSRLGLKVALNWNEQKMGVTTTRLTEVTVHGDQTNYSHWIEYGKSGGVTHEKMPISSFDQSVSEDHQCKRC